MPHAVTLPVETTNPSRCNKPTTNYTFRADAIFAVAELSDKDKCVIACKEAPPLTIHLPVSTVCSMLGFTSSPTAEDPAPPLSYAEALALFRKAQPSLVQQIKAMKSGDVAEDERGVLWTYTGVHERFFDLAKAREKGGLHLSPFREDGQPFWERDAWLMRVHFAPSDRRELCSHIEQMDEGDLAVDAEGVEWKLVDHPHSFVWRFCKRKNAKIKREYVVTGEALSPPYADLVRVVIPRTC